MANLNELSRRIIYGDTKAISSHDRMAWRIRSMIRHAIVFTAARQTGRTVKEIAEKGRTFEYWDAQSFSKTSSTNRKKGLKAEVVFPLADNSRIKMEDDDYIYVSSYHQTFIRETKPWFTSGTPRNVKDLFKMGRTRLDKADLGPWYERLVLYYQREVLGALGPDSFYQDELYRTIANANDATGVQRPWSLFGLPPNAQKRFVNHLYPQPSHLRCPTKTSTTPLLS